MKIAKTVEYAASPDEVFEVLADPAFQEAKCAATAAVKYSASVVEEGDRTVIRTERILPSDDLPDFARSMVGPTLKVVETQDWGPSAADGSRDGTVRMEVSGTPVALAGTVSLRPGGAGSIGTVDAELKAKMPLIGGKIEKAAAAPIEEAIEIEAATAQEWLAR
jgi:hypothetical protein